MVSSCERRFGRGRTVTGLWFSATTRRYEERGLMRDLTIRLENHPGALADLGTALA
jgi:hypothetical protein